MNLKKASKLLFVPLLGLQLLTACSSSSTQSKAEGEVDFPTKPIKIIVHTKAGGPTDTMARELGKAAEEFLGESVTIENQPGGSGASQMTDTMQAKPDGYTLATLTPSQIGLWNSTLKEQFNLESFSYVSGVQMDPYVIAVHADSPHQTLQDLVDAMKENPKTINVGGYGAIGSGHNIAWNIFAEKADVEANWVPYESTGEAVTVLLGKNIDVANTNPGQVSQYVKSGKIRVLGVMADQRLTEFPDVPTYKEAGFDVEASWAQFRGIFGPADIPDEIMKKLNDAFSKAMQTEGFKEYMKTAQMADGTMDNKEFANYVHNQDTLTKEWLMKLE